MNNPLVQKYNYYLNESHRLNEELKTEESYSELLENVLFELLGEEDFTKLFEYVMKGTAAEDEKGNPLSKERSERRRKRIGQIVKIGREAAKDDRTEDQTDSHLTRDRAAASLAAKGVDIDDVGDLRYNHQTIQGRVWDALRSGAKLRAGHFPSQSEREDANDRQKMLSRDARTSRRNKTNYEINTF
jgi:hypothetical protein